MDDDLPQAPLERFNELPVGAVQGELIACCGSRRWAQQMAAARPFASLDRLFSAADRVWWSLEPADWLEAFRAHPKIGDAQPAAEAAGGEQARSWSAGEQAGVRGAEASTLARLAAANRAYEERFGYLFIVCASGKSAEEMLEILERRLDNDPETELKIAAEEQAKITRLRLEKLLAG